MTPAALALAVAAAAAAVSPPVDPFAGVPDVRFVYRPITGDTGEALADSLEASAEHPPGGGSSYAQTRWAIRWHWKGRGPGRSCRIFAVDMTYEAVVTLPRLVDRSALDPRLRARWDRFERAIRVHEAGHARRGYDGVPAVRRAILASACDDADAAGHAALRRVQAGQVAYDRATRHGVAQGAHFGTEPDPEPLRSP